MFLRVFFCMEWVCSPPEGANLVYGLPDKPRTFFDLTKSDKPKSINSWQFIDNSLEQIQNNYGIILSNNIISV